ncbi:MOSC domain-containing protein [Desulfopila inferna]|uniref:MOSC domain-containing protein n=1 Tax=Desulfopila inferna TaxID=468528 RepID=UPI0019622ACD|nr:MOSC domain-containing protein [Desulfopila inferna]MBM9604838.1 MOSC domain-containing protein [Desulfopila inferna]
MGYVEAVCTSAKKGMIKKEQEKVVMKTEWGIETDAHAGDWHRQVSLLAGESIDAVKDIMPTLKKGAFAENIITRGVDLSAVAIGDRLKIGNDVTLEITQIGKECHNSGCAIKKLTGDCIMPKEGIFARVIAGGEVKAKDTIFLLH